MSGRELTEIAEEAIAGYVDEFPVKRPVELTVSLAQNSIPADMHARIPDTIRRHFTFRLNDLDHEKRLSLREGRISFAIAFNAVIAVIFVLFFAPLLEDTVFILIGGLVTILNWVTIWDTYEYFVYDYRHLTRKQKIYRKITGMDIQVRGRSAEREVP